jgi:hypothetical protein
VKKAEEMLAELQVIMQELGAKIVSKQPIERKGAELMNLALICITHVYQGYCKVSAQALQNLASEEDVSDLLNIYHEYFDANVEEEDEMPIPECMPSTLTTNDAEGDFGQGGFQWHPLAGIHSIVCSVFTVLCPSGLEIHCLQPMLYLAPAINMSSVDNGMLL